MDYHVIAPFLTSLIILGLGIVVYLHNRRSGLYVGYSIFIFSVVLWSLGITLLYYFQKPSVSLFLVNFIYFISGIIPVLFFYFSLLFSNRYFSVSRLVRVFMFLPTVVFFILYFFTNLIIAGVDIVDGVRIITYGPMRVLFDINFVLFFILAFAILVKKYFESDEIIKRQLLIIIIGTLVGAVLASITNILLLWFNEFRFFWLGPELTLVWVGFVAYAIIRHRFLDIKPLIIQNALFIVITALIGGLATIILKQNLVTSGLDLKTDSSTSTLTALLALVSGISVAILGVFVFYKNRRLSLNRVFFAMSLAIVIWLFGTYKMLTTQIDASAIFWDRFIYAGAVFIPALMYHFSRVFTKLGKEKISLIVGYLFSFVFLLLSRMDLFVSGLFYYRWGVHTQARLFHHIFLLFFFVYLFLTLRIFYIYYKKKTLGSIQKIQAKYVFVAFFILVTVGSTAYAPAYKIDMPPFSFISGLAFTIILSYAIVRHRLLDVRLFVVRSILYSLTVVSVGSFFALVVFIVGQNIFGNTFWGIIIGAVIISAGLEPLLKFLRKITDQYFFREKYNYQEILRELVQSMTKIIDLHNLLDTTTITIRKALKLNKIAVVLWDDKDGDLPEMVKQLGFNVSLETHFSKKKSLIKYLTYFQKELVTGELEIDIERGKLEIPVNRAELIKRELRNLDIAVCFPIFSNEKLTGLLVLGDKQSGEVFSNDDIELLNTFTAQASIAIVNAKLYQEVKDFNVTLQGKIDRATEHLRQSNEELRQANIKLKELDQAKSDFLSLASHQLRSPLSITKGYISMILEGTYGQPPKELIEPLEMVYNGNERLVKFVNNLLDVSRIESGRLEYVFADVDLAEMVSSVVKELKLAADKKKIYLDLKMDKDLPKIKADDEKLRQVVMNLVDNAIKYTNEGGVSVSLKMGENKKGEKGLVFSATDTGRGLEEGDKVGLFQKFSRGKNISKVHTEGTGLGLYVARQITEAHKGTIWADSLGEGKGSTFSFWIGVRE